MLEPYRLVRGGRELHEDAFFCHYHFSPFLFYLFVLFVYLLLVELVIRVRAKKPYLHVCLSPTSEVGNHEQVYSTARGSVKSDRNSFSVNLESL